MVLETQNQTDAYSRKRLQKRGDVAVQHSSAVDINQFREEKQQNLDDETKQAENYLKAVHYPVIKALNEAMHDQGVLYFFCSCPRADKKRGSTLPVQSFLTIIPFS